jgi:hypothetical protein
MADAPTAPGRPLVAIGTCWLVHGALIGSLGLLLPLMAGMVEQEDWAESMRLLGAGELIPPMRSLLAALAPVAGWLIALSIPCAGIGLAARRWGVALAWPLHGLAGIHLLLVPWSSWALHRHLGDLPGMGLGPIIGEIATVMITEIVLALAIVRVERARRARRA